MNPKLCTKHLLVLIPLICLGFQLFSQDGTVNGSLAVKGKVVDAKTSRPLPGATIRVKNGTQSTQADENGNFTIKVPSSESVISISHIGYMVYETKAGSGGSLSVSLTATNGQMDDVVVVGYGTKKKLNLLGAISVVKAEDIQDFPVANMGTALANRVPGVGVSITSGKPGATTTVTIRNPTLFAASGRLGLTQDPLYVIDGLTVPKDQFDNLDASLVESITFLKDASAAVYGASGDKGVILVTTKRGKPGKAVISYSGYYGNTTATVRPKLLNAYDHAKMLNDGFDLNGTANTSRFSDADLQFLATNPYKSWYDEIWKPAHLSRHTVNVSGGTDKITFFAGASYYNEDGNFGGISINKYNIRSGVDAKISPTVSASLTVSTDYAKEYRNTQKSSSTETEDVMMRALFQTPKWVPLTIRGLPTNWSQASINTFNPIGLFNSGDYETSQAQTLTLNATLSYRPVFVKGLTFKVQFGKITTNGTAKQYFPSYNVYNFVRKGQNGLLYSDSLPATGSTTTKVTNTDRLQEGTNYDYSYQLMASAEYARRFGKHDIDFLALAEQREDQNDSYLIYRDGQQIPGIDQMFAFNAANTTEQLNGPFESGKRSYLGKFSYMFNEKYLVDVVTRVDGSANFPPNKRWGVFPAVGLGWKVSEENFFKENLPYVNFFKLRANFGLVGDDRVTSYQYESRFTQTTGMLFGSTITNGLDPNIYPNPDITWEKARTLNYGLDASFLHTRLAVSLDIWTRHTYDGFDDLGVVSLPYTTGINTGLKNYGIQNSWGSEWTVGWRDIIGRNWGYSIDVNAAYGNNQVIQQYYSPAALGTPTEYSSIMIGKSSKIYNSANYGYIATGILRTQADVDAVLAKNPNYKINGVKPQVGYMNYKDINNDGVIDGNDVTVMYNNGTASTVVFGFTFGVTYKTIKFSTNINLYLGGKQFVDGEARKPPTTTTNAPDFWKDHWTPDNPNAKYPRADAPLITSNSTFWALSGTTSRINNATISYAMPASLSERLKIPNFRVLVSGTNLWSLVNPFKYKDINTNTFVTYPFLRTISVGLNMTL